MKRSSIGQLSYHFHTVLQQLTHGKPSKEFNLGVLLKEKISLLRNRVEDLEEWIKYLKSHSQELKDKISRKDKKIDELKRHMEDLMMRKH